MDEYSAVSLTNLLHSSPDVGTKSDEKRSVYRSPGVQQDVDRWRENGGRKLSAFCLVPPITVVLNGITYDKSDALLLQLEHLYYPVQTCEICSNMQSSF